MLRHTSPKECARVHALNTNTLATTATQCAAGSPSNCSVQTVPVPGYSAGALIRITNGLAVSKSTQRNSCPDGWKIWSPRNKNDWTIVYDAVKKTKSLDYPKNPNLIVDVTRNQNGCGGCTQYAMKSTVPEQSSWKTSDGSAWWLRDSRWKDLDGNYYANCYLHVTNPYPKNVKFYGGYCNYHSSDYFCQPTIGTCLILKLIQKTAFLLLLLLELRAQWNAYS